MHIIEEALRGKEKRNTYNLYCTVGGTADCAVTGDVMA